MKEPDCGQKACVKEEEKGWQSIQREGGEPSKPEEVQLLILSIFFMNNLIYSG